jgi:hypothetical protein
MSELLLELIPFALGLAITTAAIASCILFLGSKRPVANAVSFAAASTSEPQVSCGTKAALTLITGTVSLDLAVAGVLHGHAGPPTRTPGWMREIDTAGPRVAFGLGLALAVLNPNVPILWYVTHRSSAERGLAAVKAWLSRHEHIVNLAVLVVFGLFFTINGIASL